MNKDYTSLIESIQRRSNPENFPFEKSLSEELSTLKYLDIFKYITLAMNGVSPEYTAKSKEAGQNVQGHLKEVLSDVSYKYQGSVMTNTHIRGNSDIDLLVITEKFYSFDRDGIQETLNNYSAKQHFSNSQVEKLSMELQGGGYYSALDDLKFNRVQSELKLLRVYDICEITKPKAIKITNQNLKRDVDIVIANWYDDVNSIVNDKNIDYRGIQVYNKDYHSKGKADYPFLSIKRINEKSVLTGGRLKKMIRFLKNVKADSQLNITLSSFDFNAICYDINISKYYDVNKYDLVPIIFKQLYSLSVSEFHSNNLKSVDEHEYIFRDNPEKLNSLRNLMNEVNKVLMDINAM